MTRRPRSVRLTPRGATFLAVGVLVAAAAIVAGQRDLLRISVLLLALPILSVFVARQARVRLAAARALEPARVAVRSTTLVHLRLTASGRLPDATLLVEDRVPASLGAQPRFVVDHVGTGWRREVTYRLHAEARGRYTIGPLSTRVTDPFGLVTTQRRFSGTSVLTVTPQVLDLPRIRLSGELTGSGETRPRSVTAAGEEDTTIRPYGHGDDMRRVHWRATARHGELMVRREEQPWQSRCTVVLDTRRSAHSGSDTSSSFELAVTAAASIAVHLLGRGYSVRLISDDGASVTGSWLDPGSGPASGEGALLDGLAVIGMSRRASIGTLQGLMSGAGTGSGLLVAVMGRLTPHEISVLGRLAHDTRSALAVLLDVGSWSAPRRDRQGEAAGADGRSRSAADRGGRGSRPGSDRRDPRHGGRTASVDPAVDAMGSPYAAARGLAATGWRSVVAGRQDSLPSAWQRLDLSSLHGASADRMSLR